MPRLRKLKFWTVAVEETGNWNSDTLARNGIRAAFGLYLVKEGEATHLCELTPSSAAYWVQNAFVMDDPAAEWEDPEGLEHENGGDSGWSYFRFVDVAKHDSRFIAGPIEIDPAELDPRPEYGETLNSAAWEAAQETWNANPDHPTVTWGETFEAWQAENSAKRRAENVPPCSGRGDGTLPLFMAAAFQMFPAGVETHADFVTLKGIGWL